MKLTEAQALTLFSLAQTVMNRGGFSNFSKEEIMKLLNQILAQQDNDHIIKLLKNEDSTDPTSDNFWEN